MVLRSAAVVAGLALGSMSGAAVAAPITYDVDFSISSGGNTAHIQGFIETNGIIGTPLSASDIVNYSLNSNGIVEADSLRLYGQDLVARQTGYLIFAFTGNNAEFEVGNTMHNTALFDLIDSSHVQITFASSSYQTGEYQNESIGSDFIIGSVSPVPLPASAPMFGAALLGLAGLGYAAKRKVKTAA